MSSDIIRDSIFYPIGPTYYGLDDNFASLDTGNPAMEQITGRNSRGLQMDAAGDMVQSNELWLPRWLDPTQELWFRIHYISGSSTAADTVDWIILANFFAADTQIVNASGVLDTVIAQDTIGAATAYLNKITDWGKKNAGFLTRQQVEDGAKMLFSVELDASAVDLATEKIWFLGVEMLYTWQNFVGDPAIVNQSESSIAS